MDDAHSSAMQWLRIDDWFVVFTNPAREISPRNWEAVLEHLRDPSLRGFLSVIDHDGHPRLHAQHRHSARETFRSLSYNISVLTSHRQTLALGRILDWAGVPLRCFPSRELGQALEHIGVPEALHPRFAETIARLRREALSAQAGLRPSQSSAP